MNDDDPIFNMEMLSDFVWGFLRALGIIFTLVAILWVAGRIH